MSITFVADGFSFVKAEYAVKDTDRGEYKQIAV